MGADRRRFLRQLGTLFSFVASDLASLLPEESKWQGEIVTAVTNLMKANWDESCLLSAYSDLLFCSKERDEAVTDAEKERIAKIDQTLQGILNGRANIKELQVKVNKLIAAAPENIANMVLAEDVGQDASLVIEEGNICIRRPMMCNLTKEQLDALPKDCDIFQPESRKLEGYFRTDSEVVEECVRIRQEVTEVKKTVKNDGIRPNFAAHSLYPIANDGFYIEKYSFGQDDKGWREYLAEEAGREPYYGRGS